MKNVGELCERYYSAYKSDYDTDGELNETEREKCDHKQFELVGKTDKESKLNGKTKNLKCCCKKRFSGCFNYELSVLVNQ